MTSRDQGLPGEYVFRRQADGALQVRVRLHGVERALQLVDREAEPRAYTASTTVNAANLGLATDLLLDLTGSPLVAVQIGERLARKLAVTFAARASIDGLIIAREAIWRWLRWALTHPAAPVVERPWARKRGPELAEGLLRGERWWRGEVPSNPLRWKRLATELPSGAESWSGGRSGREN